MQPLVQVAIDKLVHGGQGLGTLESGQKIFVWNALPGETVEARIIKKKRSYLEGIAENVLTPAADRQEPLEMNYLSTSPWQIMSFNLEQQAKKQITLDLMKHDQVVLPEVKEVITSDPLWKYRNKMEYSFWGDEDGIHLALHQRGSHGKQIVSGSALAMPAIDSAAQEICAQLNTLPIRAGDLKTVVVRCDQAGNAVASLYVKPQQFPELTLPSGLQGLRVYHSNPKSPASVATTLLQELGSLELRDELLGQAFMYDVDSFFQVNLPVFERALQSIREQVSDASAIVDMYAGVGSIGLSVAKQATTLVELDAATVAMARVNAAQSALQTSVIETSAELSLEYIAHDRPIIVDPPRAGLHPKVVAQLLEVMPPQIIYLSCNPATQARDLAALQHSYDVSFFEVYNFFPRTPHIESLAVLRPKSV